MTTPARIIVVDDDEDVRETLIDYFSENGFDVFDASDGSEFRDMMKDIHFDLAILDLKMPGEDGLSLCRHIRETARMGIVMLTGASEPVDRVVGLELGADDYVAKPFEPRELLARVRSVLRRIHESGPTNDDAAPTREAHLTFADCTVDLTKRSVVRPDGKIEKLTPMEVTLLRIFAERPNRILSREALLDLADDGASDAFDRSIDLRVMRLRKKVEADPSRPRFIRTLRGEGYCFDPDGRSDDA